MSLREGSGHAVAANAYRRPWAQVGTAIVGELQAALPAAIDATIAAIRREVPSYRDLGEGATATAVRRGVEIALNRWLSLLGVPADALDEGSRAVYARIGAGEWQTGRTLEALLAAYRTGARVSWEHWSAAAVAAGADSSDLVALAEAIFVYIDELSSASAAGYADAQSADAGRRAALRSKLLAAVLDGSGDADSAHTLATSVGWRIPERVAVARFWSTEYVRWPPVALAAQVLAGNDGSSGVAVVPSSLLASELAVGGVRIVLGPVLAIGQAPESLRAVDRLVRLLEQGTVTAEPGAVVAAADFLLELAASADPLLIEALSQRVLQPLLELPSAKRAVLLETLRAWLVTGGDRGACATWLHVHPQTVSYRVGRLRELLGTSLTDWRTRQEILLVLAAGQR